MLTFGQCETCRTSAALSASTAFYSTQLKHCRWSDWVAQAVLSTPYIYALDSLSAVLYTSAPTSHCSSRRPATSLTVENWPARTSSQDKHSRWIVEEEIEGERCCKCRLGTEARGLDSRTVGDESHGGQPYVSEEEERVGRWDCERYWEEERKTTRRIAAGCACERMIPSGLSCYLTYYCVRLWIPPVIVLFSLGSVRLMYWGWTSCLSRNDITGA